jgi:hypothetical protein
MFPWQAGSRGEGPTSCLICFFWKTELQGLEAKLEIIFLSANMCKHGNKVCSFHFAPDFLHSSLIWKCSLILFFLMEQGEPTVYCIVNQWIFKKTDWFWKVEDAKLMKKRKEWKSTNPLKRMEVFFQFSFKIKGNGKPSPTIRRLIPGHQGYGYHPRSCPH